VDAQLAAYVLCEVFTNQSFSSLLTPGTASEYRAQVSFFIGYKALKMCRVTNMKQGFEQAGKAKQTPSPNDDVPSVNLKNMCIIAKHLDKLKITFETLVTF
jgi:hypothetical protein